MPVNPRSALRYVYIKYLGIAGAVSATVSVVGAEQAPDRNEASIFDCGLKAADAASNGGNAANTIACAATQLGWCCALVANARNSLALGSYISANPFYSTPFPGDSNQRASPGFVYRYVAGNIDLTERTDSEPPTIPLMFGVLLAGTVITLFLVGTPRSSR